MHMDCQTSVLRAKMSFLDTTPSGRIINRFSEDSQIVDERLPNTISLTLQQFIKLSVIFGFAMYAVGWQIAVIVAPIGYLFVSTQRYYVPTARSLRRLDAVNKSPLFSHIAETLHGLSTIRVHRMQQAVSEDNVRFLGRQMQVYFLANSANRWLSLRMQLTSTILVCSVCFFAIYVKTSDTAKAMLGAGFI